jgi:hypothetical protein
MVTDAPSSLETSAASRSATMHRLLKEITAEELSDAFDVDPYTRALFSEVARMRIVPTLDTFDDETICNLSRVDDVQSENKRYAGPKDLGPFDTILVIATHPADGPEEQDAALIALHAFPDQIQIALRGAWKSRHVLLDGSALNAPDAPGAGLSFSLSDKGHMKLDIVTNEIEGSILENFVIKELALRLIRRARKMRPDNLAEVFGEGVDRSELIDQPDGLPNASVLNTAIKHVRKSKECTLKKTFESCICERDSESLRDFMSPSTLTGVRSNQRFAKAPLMTVSVWNE